MSKKIRDDLNLNEVLPKRLIEKGFGICKTACKMAIKAGMENHPVITVASDGVCNLYRMSILKRIKNIFKRGNK
jgi:hypothetical protein